MTLVPEEPVIAFHKFRFEEHHNWIYLHKNMRVYANVDMQDNEGMGIRMQSLPSDTVSLQNMDVELRRIRLEEVFSILPYMPQITGLLSAEAHYIQTEKSLELSAEASIDELTYEWELPGFRERKVSSTSILILRMRVLKLWLLMVRCIRQFRARTAL